ncbi:MAG: amidase [Candidatus Binatus sp.]|uniref:amidase n=1 Tax=Candidatus Binatus sp. TaxID=2811406 RepID=UPI0027216577|nr:amidase [Candidatus Binatus sp.]MDO8434090.1 amidase [Candidatus Binatus sp.]
MDSQATCYLSLHELSVQLRDGKLSSVEVTRCVLDRIKQTNPTLRAYLTVLNDSALSQAAQADKEIKAGHWRGPLHGVPVAVKDLCWTKGVPTTCASKVLRDWRPDANATVVDRFEAAGAVLLGKLNLTEFAVIWYHPEFPGPINPWNASLWAGASSSGSGVATAAGLCYAAIGTDTGGSIRFPSAANGIVGLKPTWGRVSRYGVFPLGESLDHIGPMTRSVLDAALVLGVIAGRDPNDDTSLGAHVDDYAAAANNGVKGTRIGLDESYIGGASPEVAAAVIEAARTLEREGARIVKVTMPDIDPTLPAWTTICAAETLAAHAATYPKQAADYGPGFRSFLELGATITGEAYANAHMVRERFANRFQALFDQVDVVACPSMASASLPATGFPTEARAFVGPNPLLGFTGPFNLSRNPTLSQPCGASVDGAIPSLQLIARRLGEATLIQTGAAYERATEWHKQRPPV